MKTNIHPQWYPEARVSCACGNVFTIGSTRPEFRVEICSNCHPFFTGQMKFVDTMGKVEKFQAKMAASNERRSQIKKKVEERVLKDDRPRTLREMLQLAKK